VGQGASGPTRLTSLREAGGSGRFLPDPLDLPQGSGRVGAAGPTRWASLPEAGG